MDPDADAWESAHIAKAIQIAIALRRRRHGVCRTRLDLGAGAVYRSVMREGNFKPKAILRLALPVALVSASAAGSAELTGSDQAAPPERVDPERARMQTP